MTAIDLQFTIDTTRSRVSVANFSVPMTNTLPVNVKYVSFAKGVGQVIYNDRLAIPELFTDPTPYQGYVDQWMTAMASASPALTLGQAQAIECAVINAIATAKRQTPVSVKVSAGTYAWDASDDVVTHLSTLAGLLYIDPLNTLASTLAAWATNYNSLNSSFSGLGASLQTMANSIISNVNSAFTGMKANLDLQETGVVSGWSTAWATGSVSGVTAPTTSPATADVAVTQITAPAIKLIPVGATSPVSLTPTDLQSVVLAIAAQNVKYQTTNAAKQAAVNALGSVAAVVAYDATSGW